MVTCPPARAAATPPGRFKTDGTGQAVPAVREEPVKLLLALMLLAAVPAEERREDVPGDRAAQQPATAPAADRWEKDISAFEAADKVAPFPKGGVVFVGSSTI